MIFEESIAATRGRDNVCSGEILALQKSIYPVALAAHWLPCSLGIGRSSLPADELVPGGGIGMLFGRESSLQFSNHSVLNG